MGASMGEINFFILIILNSNTCYTCNNTKCCLHYVKYLFRIKLLFFLKIFVFYVNKNISFFIDNCLKLVNV